MFSEKVIMLSIRSKVSSHGLVVKADKTYDRKVQGSNPHYGHHFSGTIHLHQSLEQKLWKNSYLALLHVLLSH
jgi:hypothetical protein